MASHQPSSDPPEVRLPGHPQTPPLVYMLISTFSTYAPAAAAAHPEHFPPGAQQASHPQRAAHALGISARMTTAATPTVLSVSVPAPPHTESPYHTGLPTARRQEEHAQTLSAVERTRYDRQIAHREAFDLTHVPQFHYQLLSAASVHASHPPPPATRAQARAVSHVFSPAQHVAQPPTSLPAATLLPPAPPDP